MLSRGKLPVGLLVKLGLALAVLITLGVLLLRGVDVRAADVRGAIDAGFVQIRAAGPWAFFGAMALLPVAGFPLSPFYLAAGEAFAARLTMPGVLALAFVANAVQFALSFWVAHRALRPLITRLLARTRYQVPQVSPENELSVALLLRVTPGPPMFLQNYLLGLSGIRFRTYMLASLAVQGVLGSATIIFGQALLSGRGGLAVLGFFVLVAAFALVRLFRQRIASRNAGRA